jgi:hypothetical protein
MRYLAFPSPHLREHPKSQFESFGFGLNTRVKMFHAELLHAVLADIGPLRI